MNPRLEFAVDLARRVGALLREGYGRASQVRHKEASIDLVTEYDLRSEQLLADAIRDAFPEDAILAEEGGSEGQGEGCWWIDPLDGTTNFAHGLPIFAICMTYARSGRPALGVVHDPMRQETFYAEAGGGAWLDGQRLHVSQTRSLDESLLVTGFPYDIRTNPDNNLDHFAALALRSRGVRRLGAAALDLAYVAAGRFDGYWELRLWPWDWGAGILLVSEAGGRVSRMDGGQDIFAQPTSLLATNGHIHEAMLEALNPNRRHAS